MFFFNHARDTPWPFLWSNSLSECQVEHCVVGLQDSCANSFSILTAWNNNSRNFETTLKRAQQTQISHARQTMTSNKGKRWRKNSSLDVTMLSLWFVLVVVCLFQSTVCIVHVLCVAGAWYLFSTITLLLTQIVIVGGDLFNPVAQLIKKFSVYVVC